MGRETHQVHPPHLKRPSLCFDRRFGGPQRHLIYDTDSSLSSAAEAPPPPRKNLTGSLPHHSHLGGITLTATTIPQIHAHEARRYLEALITCDELSSLAAVRVAQKILQGYRADWGYCCYSIKQLAAFCRTSIRAVCYALKELERLRFIGIDRTHSRNRYTPLVGQLPAPRRKRVVLDDPAHCSALHSTDVQPAATHNIEKPKSDSLAESDLAPYKNIKKPTATRSERVATCSPLVLPKDWRSFREQVMAHWRIPPGWDRWAFERSVDAFVTNTRKTSPIWEGVRLASARLKGWMRREHHKTEMSFSLRGFDEWIEE